MPCACSPEQQLCVSTKVHQLWKFSALKEIYPPKNRLSRLSTECPYDLLPFYIFEAWTCEIVKQRLAVDVKIKINIEEKKTNSDNALLSQKIKRQNAMLKNIGIINAKRFQFRAENHKGCSKTWKFRGPNLVVFKTCLVFFFFFGGGGRAGQQFKF